MSYFIIGGDGKEYGPKPDSEVRDWIAEGRLNAQSQIRRQSDANWIALSDLPEFAGDLFGTTPSAPVTQQYQQPYPQYSAPAQSGTNGLATAGMICGIVSLPTLCCCYGMPFNILGIIFSIIGLSQIKKSIPPQSGKGMAMAGLICSIISLVLLVVIFALGIAANVAQL
tara:strand:+ start:586 stop:1092 length:507 start_codon:yes stop_codon:yes gene_type:complete